MDVTVLGDQPQPVRPLTGRLHLLLGKERDVGRDAVRVGRAVGSDAVFKQVPLVGQPVLLLHELPGVHQGEVVVGRLRREAAAVVDPQAAGPPAPGGDQHDAVGGRRAVDGRRAGVLEHRHRGDVFRVEEAERIPVDAAIETQVGIIEPRHGGGVLGHGHPVDDVERGVVAARRDGAPDVDRDAAARLGRARLQVQAGRPPLQELVDRGGAHGFEPLHVHRRDGAAEVALPLRDVPDHHDVLQHLHVRHERHVDHLAPVDGDELRHVPDEGENEGVPPGRHLQAVRSVHPGGRAPVGAPDHDVHPGQRRSFLPVGHLPSHGMLGPHRCRSTPRQEEQEQQELGRSHGNTMVWMQRPGARTTRPASHSASGRQGTAAPPPANRPGIPSRTQNTGSEGYRTT